jgi:hypothetical protein
MAKINVESGGTILSTGLLQLSGGAAMSTTLRSVTDQNNTASQLKLATNLTQVAGTLQIALDGGSYIDAQDVSGIDRFNVNRSAGSQQVNVDFSSNPTSGTDAVGALRTYANGVALSEAMTFLRNGNVGVGTTTPAAKFDIGGNVINTIQAIFARGANDSSFQLAAETGNASGAGGTTMARLGLLYNGVGSVAKFYFQRGVSSGTGAILTDAPLRINDTSTTLPTAQLTIKGSGSTSATTSLLVQNSGGTEKFKITDGLNSDIIMRSNPKTNGDGVIIQSSTGTDQTPQLTMRPLTGAGAVRIWGDADRAYFAMTNSNGVQSDNIYAFTIDNRRSKFAVTPDGSTTDASFYGKAIWDGGSAMTLRASSATQTARIFNVENFDSSVNYLNVGATGIVALGTTSPNASAKLQVDSTTQGFLPPRMTNAQRAAIAAPAIGLMVYCTDAVEGLYIYKSTGWTFVI